LIFVLIFLITIKPYNPNRMCHVNVQLAMADPT
jgi:hypothetical protein